MGTDRPLYFTKDYELVYRDDDLPTHYGFKVGSKFDRLEKRYGALQKEGAQKASLLSKPKPQRMKASLTENAKRVIKDLDKRGAWVETGQLRNFPEDEQSGKVISSRTYVRNLTILTEYLAANRK